MRRRYNNPDDYAYDYAHAAGCDCATCNPGYFHNPARGEREEAESQRVMAIVQYVFELATYNANRTEDAFYAAQAQKKIEPLVKAAIGTLQQYHDLTKRQKEALLAGLSDPDYVDIFSVDKVYYVDELAAEDLLSGGSLTAQDPGVLISGEHKTKFALSTRGKRKRRGAGRERRRPFQKRFLREIWPRITDADVRNAVRILQQQGITFLRRHLISYKAWRALGDDNAPMARFAPATIRSREEFLSAYATEEQELGDVVLRLNLGAVLDAMAKIDFAPDDVVYRHSGDANSIGGASAKGFYVARLRPSQLTLEGMSPPVGLGICVGGDGYRDGVESGRMQIYGIRTPGGKPKFTIDVHLDSSEDFTYEDEFLTDEEIEVKRARAREKPVPPFFSVKQVKGKANRLPGFDPDSEVFKGEAGVDDVRVVVEFLADYLGMEYSLQERGDRETPRGMPYAPQAINDIRDLQAGLLSMQRIGIDPFSPPVKGQTWEKVSAEREAKRQALRGLGRALDEMRAAQRPLGVGEQVALPPAVWPPRENPDPLAYTDPEVAALARAAYARPMGGRWTYEDDVEDEGEGGE